MKLWHLIHRAIFQISVGVFFISIVCLTCFLVFSAHTLEIGSSGEDGTPLSPTDFVVDISNNQILVAQKTGLRIDFIDFSSGQLLASIPTKFPPTGICLSNDGKAYVTCSYSSGEVLVIDAKSRRTTGKIDAGNGAISPVYSPVSNILYVANQYDNDISIIDLETAHEIVRIDVLRQPMSMDITPDGLWLYVANLLPATRADIDSVASDVTVIDLSNISVLKHIKLSNGSNALRGIKVSKDGKQVFVSHNLGRFQVPTSQLEKGWMNTSALSILDVANQELMATVLLDEPENGAAGSWGIDVNEKVIVVAHSATHDYSIIDFPAMIKKLGGLEDLKALSYDLTFLRGLRERIPVQGDGPRAIRLVKDKVVSALYFSDAIQVDNLDTKQTIRKFDFNPNLTIDSVRMGEMAFNDARHCFQQWQACTGCHPNNARTDGLNWDLLNDGIGNPKNCKSMLLAHETPPSMITGIRPTAEISVRAGFRHIQFMQIDEGNAKAVDHYLKSLKPIPSPYLKEGKLSRKAKKGKKVYHRVGCGHCHSGPYFTDGKQYEIGIPGPADRNNVWDTPTLIEVWRTAPYLHDGRSATLEEVFVKEKHGLNDVLDKESLSQLLEYVLSL